MGGGWKKRWAGKKKRRRGDSSGLQCAASLEEKVSRGGGKNGYGLEGGEDDRGGDQSARSRTQDDRRRKPAAEMPRRRTFEVHAPSSKGQHSEGKRLPTPADFQTPAVARGGRDGNDDDSFSLSSRPPPGRSSTSASSERFSLSSRASATSKSNPYRTAPRSAAAARRRLVGVGGSTPASAISSRSRASGAGGGGSVVHVTCAISENLARETCVASLDAGAPVALHVTKQGNGQTYAETLAYLEVLRPDEVLLNEGRRNSQLAQKVQALFGQEVSTENPMVVQRTRRSKAQTDGRSARRRRKFVKAGDGGASADLDGMDGNSQGDDLTGACTTSTVVKFVPRSYFDQTKGAELLRRVVRDDSYDASVVEEYILLSSSYAVLQYAQLCLGATFSRNCLELSVNSGGNNRMAIDRATLLQLELLSNAKTGRTSDSLIGTIDCTKTSVGARLLRTNIMAPPTRVDTINARLDLVDTMLEDEEFFYVVMEHLEALPDVERMLTHMALVPRKQDSSGGHGDRAGNGALFGNGEQRVTARMASRGISALVCIKSTLSVIPTFAGALESQLRTLDAREGQSTNQRHLKQQSSDHGSGSNSDDDDDEDGSDDDETREATSLSSSIDGDEVAEDSTKGTDDSTQVTTASSLLVGLGSGPTSSIGQSTRHQLLRAILLAMRQPALNEILAAVMDIFTESTTYSRNSHAMRHQECFALKPNTDGMMDVLRKAFLANVDDIYRLADEYAETFGMTVAVKETTGRGYFLSVPFDATEDLPPVFIQPVKSGRFIHCTTEEVHSLNARAQDNVQDLLLMTHERIQEVIDVARTKYDALASLSDAIALLDLCHCFADNVASSRLPWCRPVVTDCGSEGDSAAAELAESSTIGGSGAIAIRNGRYAIDVSGAGLMVSDAGPLGSEYVPNDTYASAFQNFTVITGINGSGKSTYLRQIAIFVILAHCGSYVPAEEAFIPVRDRLCTRIGTSDDQEHNISTFMLEMKETAFICSNATNKSLILIDELGRATSNEDGVAIAWAVSEFLLVKRAMSFFVTHYPQLSRLADVYPNVQNQHLGATVSGGNDGDIRYTHKILPGPCQMAADYGVEMAATCGWPEDVVQEARALRSEIEQKLPDGALCQHQSGSSVDLVDARRKAEGILSDTAKHLVALKESQGRLSSDAKRSYLQDLRDRVPLQDCGLVQMIKNLLVSDDQVSLPPLPFRSYTAKNKESEQSGDSEQDTTATADGGEGTPKEHDEPSCSKQDRDEEMERIKDPERYASLEKIDRNTSRSSTSSGAETSTAMPSTAPSSKQSDGDSYDRSTKVGNTGSDVAADGTTNTLVRVVDQVPTEKDSMGHGTAVDGKDLSDKGSLSSLALSSSSSSVTEHGRNLTSGEESSSISSDSSSSDSSSDSDDSGSSRSNDSVSLD